jgi:hypothetical protein
MDKNKWTTLMLISTAGLLLTWWGLCAGASQASPSTPPSPLVDDLVDRVPRSAQVSVRRIQTVTLDPALDDLMQTTWPVRVEDTIYNKPGGTPLILPVDACDDECNCDNVDLSLADGFATTRCEASAIYIDLPLTPDPQPWVAVTYRTRTRAVRQLGLIAVTAGASTNPPNPRYDPITVTLIYTRPMPPEGYPDYWGVPPTFPILRNVSPSSNDRSDEKGQVRWAETAYGITGTVIISEPLFGSDLTITQFLMSPATPKFRERAFFTATIQNIGVMTAGRWYIVELYVKPASALPPQNAEDHEGGWKVYGLDALFGGQDFKQPPLGPGQTHIVTTAINIPLPGTFKAYAQVDTSYTDPNLYAWWGSNPEGYGIPPYPEERNILGAEPFTVQGSIAYLPIIRRK